MKIRIQLAFSSRGLEKGQEGMSPYEIESFRISETKQVRTDVVEPTPVVISISNALLQKQKQREQQFPRANTYHLSQLLKADISSVAFPIPSASPRRNPHLPRREPSLALARVPHNAQVSLYLFPLSIGPFLRAAFLCFLS